MNNKAVIYSRVSSTNERQDYKRQTNELIEYAKYAKLEVLATFEEKISGTTKTSKRIEFSKMQEYIKANDVQNVLCWELSRIGRNLRDVINVVNDFTDLGINVYMKKEGLNTLNENGEKNPLTNTMIAMLSGFAEIEVETTRSRIKSGLRNSKLNGGANGAIQPYGFKAINKKLVICPEESKVVKTIFKMYMQGLGTIQIARYLNEQKIPTKYNIVYGEKEIKNNSKTKPNKKGNQCYWRNETICNMLKNPIYTGIRKHKDEQFSFPELAIISKKDFKTVQQKLKENTNRIEGVNTVNNFRGLLYCGNCGEKYYIHKRQNNRDSSYKCMSKRRKLINPNLPVCNNPSIGIKRLNNAVKCFLHYSKFHNDLIKKANTKDKLKELNNELKVNTVELKSKENKLKQVKNQIDELLDLKLNNIITTEIYTNKFDELNNELHQIEPQIEQLLININELKELIKKVNNTKKIEINDNNFKTIVKQLIKSITIFESVGMNDLNPFKKYKQDVIINAKIEFFNGFIAEIILSRKTNFVYYKSTSEAIKSKTKPYSITHNQLINISDY